MGRKKVKQSNFLGAVWTTLAVFGGIYLVTETVLYHKVTTDSMFACTKLCEQDGKQVLQLSMDVCLCEGEEGRKAQDGYQRVLNEECGRAAQCPLPRRK